MTAGQLDDGDGDRGCEQHQRAGDHEEPAFAPAPIAGRSACRRLEDLVVREDGPLELLQGRAGLEPELIGERPPGVSVDLECFRLPPGPVEREHQLAAQAFA